MDHVPFFKNLPISKNELFLEFFSEVYIDSIEPSKVIF
jgi:hypothetical protein